MKNLKNIKNGGIGRLAIHESNNFLIFKKPY